MDGFASYLPIKIQLEDQYKKPIITEWGAYEWLVMRFGLKNAFLSYQRVVNYAFKDYVKDFMKLFLDAFSIYCDEDRHLTKPQLCFDGSREYGLCIDSDKCIFMVASRMILGFVVSKEG